MPPEHERSKLIVCYGHLSPFEGLRGLTWIGGAGLEPATFGVTGRRSNQLNYDPAERRIIRELGLPCHRPTGLEIESFAGKDRDPSSLRSSG